LKLVRHLPKVQTKDGSSRILVVVSDFNSIVTDRLLEGCLSQLEQKGGESLIVDLYRVPGAMEIPYILSVVLSQKRHVAAIALGCVIRGETGHYEAVVSGVTSGIMNQSQIHHVPVIFGVLTTNTLMEALDRVGGKSGHKGVDAASCALFMAGLSHTFGSATH
jgi:6,7-dimethyl-8-ribityllumazine synthase